jgi:hypothetical protein
LRDGIVNVTRDAVTFLLNSQPPGTVYAQDRCT